MTRLPVPSGPSAALRVYEPLAAFPPRERARWEALLAAGGGLDRAAAQAHERAAGLRAAVRAALPDDDGAALVTEVDGIALVCPLDLRTRSVTAFDELAGDLPDLVADALVPRHVADAARAALEDALQDAVGDDDPRGPWVLDSTWHVPLRWFVLVDPEERTVSLGEGSVRTGRELVYRTAMSRARRRVARALAVLRRRTEDGDVVAAVEDLARWLEGFHPRSLVELDYGGLVHLLDDAELLQDDSARDVADALTALGEGRAEEAATAYARVTSRMKALQAVESRS